MSELITSLPDGWSMTPLGRLAKFGNGQDYKDVETSEGGYPVYGSGGEFRRATRYLHDGESVLFGRKGTIDRPLYVNGKFWTVDTMYYTIPEPNVYAKYIYYAATTIPFNLYSTNTALPSMTSGALKAHRIPFPPLDEQRAIADYLDQETAQVDALVAKQEEFIGLLRERRTRARDVLAERVAVGTRLRWILREFDHRAGALATDLPLYSVSIDWGVRRRDETTDKLARAEDLSHYKMCLKGDIIVNRMRAFQGALGIAPADGIVSPDYAVLRATPDADPQWLAELMRTKAFVGEIILRLRGIGGMDSGNVRTPRINTADLLDIRASVPETTAQRMELTTVVAETSRIDTLIAKAEEHIALAKERRTALITAAVTGQFDVRTARKAG